MKAHDDFLDPKKNKKERTFPITHRKPVLLVGVDKDSSEPSLEYYGDSDQLKQGLKDFKGKCKNIKSYGIWPGRWRSMVFELEIEK